MADFLHPSSKLYFRAPSKTFETFAPHGACASLLVALPIVAHVAHAGVTGDGGVLFLNDAYGFLGDVMDLCFLLMGSRRYKSTPVRASRAAVWLVTLVTKALLWPLCTHIAASILLDAKPPLTQSIRVTCRVFWRVMATALAAVLPLVSAILALLTMCLTAFLLSTHVQRPWFSRLEYATDQLVTYISAGDLALLVSTVLLLLVVLSLSCVFCFALVVVAVELQTHPVSALWESAKLTRGFFRILLIYNLQIHVICVNYQQVARDFKEWNVEALALHVLFICCISLAKVCAVIICCIVYLRRRSTHVEEGEKMVLEKVAAVIIRAPFEGSDKAAIAELVANFDESLKHDVYSSHLLVDTGGSHAQ